MVCNPSEGCNHLHPVSFRVGCPCQACVARVLRVGFQYGIVGKSCACWKFRPSSNSIKLKFRNHENANFAHIPRRDNVHLGNSRKKHCTVSHIDRHPEKQLRSRRDLCVCRIVVPTHQTLPLAHVKPVASNRRFILRVWNAVMIGPVSIIGAASQSEEVQDFTQSWCSETIAPAFCIAISRLLNLCFNLILRWAPVDSAFAP